MSNKSGATQAQRKQRYPAHINVAPIRVIGRNKASSKLWIKQRGGSTRLVDESEITK